MRLLPIVSCLLLPCRIAVAQPADCAAPPPVGSIPLGIDVGGRPGLPMGTSAEVFMDVPVAGPGYACPATPPPANVLNGEPGDVLQGPHSRDLLLGPGTPRVRIAPQ